MKNVRLFGITFGLSLAILCSIGAVLLLLPRQPEATSSAEWAPSYYPNAEDNLSILAIGKENEENNGLFFTLLRFDAKNKRLTLVGLPPDTEVNFGIETATLNRHYQQGGGRGAVRAVRQALRVSVDRYAVFEEDDLMILADQLGGVEFELSQGLENDTVNLQAGRQMLDGSRFRDAVLFDSDYQLDLELLQALIEQRVEKLSPENAKQFADKLLGLLDTNVTSYDYERRKEALSAWAKAPDNLQIFTLEGRYDPKGELFQLAPASVERLQKEVYGLTS